MEGTTSKPSFCSNDSLSRQKMGAKEGWEEGWEEASGWLEQWVAFWRMLGNHGFICIFLISLISYIYAISYIGFHQKLLLFSALYFISLKLIYSRSLKCQAFGIYIFNKANLALQPDVHLYSLSSRCVHSIISLRN
jgi:hypothetical protein